MFQTLSDISDVKSFITPVVSVSSFLYTSIMQDLGLCFTVITLVERCLDISGMQDLDLCFTVICIKMSIMCYLRLLF